MTSGQETQTVRTETRRSEQGGSQREPPVGRGHAAEALVVALVVVVLYEGRLNRPVESSSAFVGNFVSPPAAAHAPKFPMGR